MGGAGDTTISGALQNALNGGAKLGKTGAGTLTLSGNNAASASQTLFNLSNGVISIASANAIGVPTGANYPDKFNFLGSTTLRLTSGAATLGRYAGAADNAGFRIANGVLGTFDVASGAALTIDGVIANVSGTAP